MSTGGLPRFLDAVFVESSSFGLVFLRSGVGNRRLLETESDVSSLADVADASFLLDASPLLAFLKKARPGDRFANLSFRGSDSSFDLNKPLNCDFVPFPLGAFVAAAVLPSIEPDSMVDFEPRLLAVSP